MKSTLTTLVSIAVACVGLGSGPSARAAHFTNFLDTLQAEVSARLETNEDAAERRALTSANKTLNRNTKKLSQDLGLFGSALKTLNRAFSGEDEALANAANGSFNGFLTEAESQLNAVREGAAIHTTVPRSLSNALAQADLAYSNALNNPDWAARIRALNLTLTKVRVAQIQLTKSIKAPELIEDRDINVTARFPGERPFKFTLAGNGTYDTGAGEVGTWNYARTSANTGVVTLTPDGGSSYAYDITFNNSKRGSLTGDGDLTGSVVVR
jgi:hypothetical protein